MEIVHFNDPADFRENVLETLVCHEAENNLLLGILANLITGEYNEHAPYLAVYKEGGAVLAAALCTPPWPVLISYENPPPKKEVFKSMLEDMQAFLQDDFTGLSGNKDFVSPLVACWEEKSEKKALLKMAMRIYKLEEVKGASGVPGWMRPAASEDHDLLLSWYGGFHRDSIAEEPDPVYVQNQVKAYLEADPGYRGLMIWEDGGRPVSMAGYAGPTPHGIRIGAVYTPPDFRRRGYAGAVTAGVSQHLLDQGFEFCFLFTDLMNPTSNHIYQQIGYQPVCDVDRYLFC